MKKQAGVTLIELVMVIVVLGILAAVAVPRFVDLSSEATTAAQTGNAAAVRSALTSYIAANKVYPTVTELGTFVSDGTVVATGIQVTINGANVVIPTYTDAGCSAGSETTAVGNTVMCVGTP